MLLLLLAACGPGSASLLRTETEPAGAHCPGGGTAVSTGLDDDGDGVLEDDEVDDTSYICAGASGADGADGADGTDGADTLVQTSEEPAGDNCADGGTRVDAGADDDGDGVLDPEEIDETTYVCQGADGADGPDALVAASDEPAGENCPSGGLRLDAGLDENRNGVLDADEVAGTTYVCDGTTGADGSSAPAALVSTATEPAGEHCALGGLALSVGTDDDGDGVLGDDEVDTVTYLCDGADGADADGGWTAGTIVAGDYTITSSLDISLLEGVEQITGTLTIQDGEVGDVVLPDLQTVGSLLIGDDRDKTELDLDALSLPALTTVERDLDIHWLEVPDQTGLDALLTVGGDLTMGQQGSVGLDMLHALQTVGGDLEITPKDTSAELAGFDALTSVGGELLLTLKVDKAITAFGVLDSVGALYIEGGFTDDDLSGFAALTTIHGDFTIKNVETTNLDAFAALRTVDGDLWLYYLQALTDVRGLSGLSSLGGGLRLEKCKALVDLTGLDGITTLGGRLNITSSALTSLEGFENLESAYAITVESNSGLTSLDGLEHIDLEDYGQIRIYSNSVLSDISALSGVEGSLGKLEVYNDPYLTSLHGLEGVTSIGWEGSGLYTATTTSTALDISKNTRLVSLDGLDGLTALTWGGYRIASDSALCVSLVNSFMARFPTASGTWTSVTGNRSGC